MCLFNRIKQKAIGKIIDIVEWTDDNADTMIWRFPRYHAEIKNGAQLIVREAQVAVLVNEDRFADVYQPGRYEFTTNNMPILTTQKRRKNGFNSSFKVDAYFVSTKQFLNQRWGMVNPIMMRDPEFGPIRFRAFGSYCFRIEPNPIKFVRNVVGIDRNFTADSVTEQLHNFVITKFTDYLVESKIAALDLAANLNEFSSELTIALKHAFLEYGIELTRFSIENILLPEALEEAIDKHTTMGITNNMVTYTQMINPQNGHPHNTVGIKPQQGAPPPMSPQEMYHVAVCGVQQGPFPMAQLHQMAQQGLFTSDTLVWTVGMAGWAAANSVPSLSQLFGAIPPSL